ncbi:alpha/beta fold hydrolase [Streptomyces sp. NPDC101776]|uniref:alpha/beta fold hydrolase n=1 Tax=Streptomyces sp. NPDC101776 TaxID=3366146 RepID=UPI00382E2ED7
MPTFAAPDGTRLAHHTEGDGPPLICLPGGPMRDSAYLGTLGGLTAHRRLIRLDLRGTGASEVPQDPESYRCDRLVDDVEALRDHLGLDRIDLLAHSAGANLAALYTARHPDRVARLTLVTPSVYAVGIGISAEDRLAVARLRGSEPWFGPAFSALEQITAGRATPDSWEAIAPFAHARWDERARAFEESDGQEENAEAADTYAAEGAFDPPGTRAALAGFTSPVLVLAGEFDISAPPRAMAQYAELFPNAEFTVQPGAGHMPWRDDAERFVALVESVSSP